jgi:hypothetical protein
VWKRYAEKKTILAMELRNMPINMENIEWIIQLYEEKPDFETGIYALCLMLAEIDNK